MQDEQQTDVFKSNLGIKILIMPTLGVVLGTILVVVLIDALFLDGMIRKWAWKRIKNSGKGRNTQ